MSMKRFFQAVETHSGEPMRVVTGGIPNIPGNSVYEQMEWLRDNDDQFRLLMDDVNQKLRNNLTPSWS